MNRCTGCGRTDRPLRDDGDCFGCHVRGIAFTFVGGGGYTRQTFHDFTIPEAIHAHCGDAEVTKVS